MTQPRFVLVAVVAVSLTTCKPRPPQLDEPGHGGTQCITIPSCVEATLAALRDDLSVMGPPTFTVFSVSDIKRNGGAFWLEAHYGEASAGMVRPASFEPSDAWACSVHLAVDPRPGVQQSILSGFERSSGSFRTVSGHVVAFSVHFLAADESLRSRVVGLAVEHFRRLDRVLEDR